MIPKIYSPNQSIIEKFCTTPITLLTYELCCFYMNCEMFYFPELKHSRFNVIKNPSKQFLYKNVYKMIEKYSEKLSSREFMGFIKAQFEIMKMNEQFNPLITPSMLHSSKSEYRYTLWLQLLAQKQLMESNKENKINTKYIDHLMNISKQNINKIFGDKVCLDEFVINSKKLILMAKTKQISNVYCFVSTWIKKLDKDVYDEIYKVAECNLLEKVDSQQIIDSYNKYFDNELIC